MRAEAHGSDPATTNNRMELMALIEAYEALPRDARVTVYSDSQLCVKTINEWAEAWEERGWRRKTGPIANLELVQELYRLARRTPERVARVDPRARRLALERVRRRAGELVPARARSALDRNHRAAHGRARRRSTSQ